MGCGTACVCMVCDFFGKKISYPAIDIMLDTAIDGVSMLSIEKTLNTLGIEAESLIVTVDSLPILPLPAVIHWNQNHFVILYKISKDRKYFFIADPAKGFLKIQYEHFVNKWGTNISDSVVRGIIMTVRPCEDFYKDNPNLNKIEHTTKKWKFIFDYIRAYRAALIHIISMLSVGSALQLLLPFLTQAIVDKGIRSCDIGLIWLILIGELLIVMGTTASDFIRSRLLLHISMRLNVTLVSDFFIKLLKLPMSFFDSKLMGDLLQRINDHSKVQAFLTSQSLSFLFTAINFIVLGIVLLTYDMLIFSVFCFGSMIYTIWICLFLKKRSVINYELFEYQAKNQSKTYEFVTSLQEIKLQGCEVRRRYEWEDIQAEIFEIQLKTIKIQQIQESGCVFINECKNIFITVLAASAVINGQMTLGGMLAIQFIIGQLNSPIEQLVSFVYSAQDVLISLDRISEVHNTKEECDPRKKYMWSEG